MRQYFRSFMIALVLLVSVRPATGSEAHSDVFVDLLSCGLVVKGNIASITSKQARIADALPMLLPTFPNPDMRVDYKEVTISISEVLKGPAQGNVLAFVVETSVSTFRDNYYVGESCIVGLKWSDEALGGVYYLFSDRARFVQERDGWVRQRDDLALDNIDELRTALTAAEPHQVLNAADLVITGRLRTSTLRYGHKPGGVEYTEETLHLDDVETLKGVYDGGEAVVRSIISGSYWPAWREEETYPRMTKGERYCLFLRRVDGDLVLFRGANSVFQIEGGALRSLGAHRPTDLTVDGIANDLLPGS
jgi:hypothetical protein